MQQHINRVNTVDFKLCETCAEIAVQGYSDSIFNNEEHQKKANNINNNLLPAGYYWLESSSEIEEDYTSKCENCHSVGVSHRCSGAINAVRS